MTTVDAQSMAPGTAYDPEVEAAVKQTLRRILVRFVLGLVGLVLVLAIAGYVFRDPLVDASRWFVDGFGGFGVALGFFIGDAFTLPWPHELFTAFGLMGDIGFWTVLFWASLGSQVGASVGYLIGRGLAHTPWYSRLMGSRGDEMDLLAKRYGSLLLVLGALTPITYSVTSWTVAALGMRYGKFVLLSLFRIPRILLYEALIYWGVLSFVQ